MDHDCYSPPRVEVEVVVVVGLWKVQTLEVVGMMEEEYQHPRVVERRGR
jgi:hypothetical protein